MSRKSSGGIGREQILAQIAVLGEVRNSGLRDKRFQQWRQITTTLLQRMWPDDPGRAQEFCRIQFGVTTILPNPRLTHEHFEKGCNAAEAYLSALVKEVESQPESSPPAETPAPAARPAPAANPVTLVKRVPEAPDASSAPPASTVRLITPTAEAPAPDPVVADETPAPGPAVANETAVPPPVVPGATVVTQAPVSPEAHVAEVTQPRLKDMLGLGDLTLAPNEPAAPAGAPSTPSPAATPKSASRAAKATPVVSVTPPPVVSITPPPPPRPRGRDLEELAAQAESLGVPAGDAVFIRAALIDLGRQAGTGTPSWSAVRDTIALSLAHPRLTRRLLPLLMPYLDAAA